MGPLSARRPSEFLRVAAMTLAFAAFLSDVTCRRRMREHHRGGGGGGGGGGSVMRRGGRVD